jgi:hypothetical protein
MTFHCFTADSDLDEMLEFLDDTEGLEDHIHLGL